MERETTAEQKRILTERIKMKALELGFSHAGAIPCEDLPEYAAHVEARPSYDRFTKDNPASFAYV